MFQLIFAEYDDIIQICHCKIWALKYFVYKLLKVQWAWARQRVWHWNAICRWVLKCCFWLPLLTETNVVVSTVKIQHCEDFGIVKLSKHLVNFWQMVQPHTTSGTRVNFHLQCVDSPVVHTYALLGGFTRGWLLGNYHYGTGPWDEALLNDTSTFQLCYFFLDPVMVFQW